MNTKLFQMSETTEKLLKEAFMKGTTNPTRRQWKTRYGDPRSVPTRVPKLDKMVKDRLRPDTTKMDRALARLQALTLDAVGPLTSLLELREKEELTPENAMAAAKLALRFIGNASVQTSRERRKRAINDMNPKLTEFAE